MNPLIDWPGHRIVLQVGVLPHKTECECGQVKYDTTSVQHAEQQHSEHVIRVIKAEALRDQARWFTSCADQDREAWRARLAAQQCRERADQIEAGHE